MGKSCCTIQFIGQLLLSASLITLGVHQRREAHHDYSPNLQFIHDWVKSQGVEIDVTSMRYIQLAMAFILILTGFATLFRRSALLKSLIAIAVIFVFAQSLVMQFQLFKDTIVSALTTGTDNIQLLDKLFKNFAEKIYNEKLALALVYLDYCIN